MEFHFSNHAEWEMVRRGISRAAVESVLAGPEQRIPDESHPERWVYQSRKQFDDGKLYLLRVCRERGATANHNYGVPDERD